VLGGGSVIQEIHAPLGTNDFGPYLAKLDQKADALFFFAPGSDSLRFGDQFQTYVTNKKMQVIDVGGQLTGGPVLAQLKDKLDGVDVSGLYFEGGDSTANKSFLASWKAKYPDQPVSLDAAQGYAGAQFLEAALKKVNGNIEDKQAFLNAMYSSEVDTAKGPIKLDSDHDVIENVYVYQMVKNGTSPLGQKLLQTYTGVTRGWNRQPGMADPGALKDKWVGMTKEKLLSSK
jgi:branched-chain amino acid transport system substrate-binding protein